MTRSSRRKLLKRAVTILGGAALPMAGTRLLAQPATSGPLSKDCIDAHSHIWTPDVERYPLARGFTPEQMQPRSFTPEQLLAQARPCGVNRVVLIQMSYYGFDNRYMLDAMRAQPGTFSGVAVIDEHGPNVAETMRDLKRQGVRGFRIHPGQQQADRWLASPGMEAMWKFGAENDLAMCALVNPEALPALDRMCEKHPNAPLVIDHFSRIGVDGTVRAPDLDNLCRISRHGRAHVKVSAFYALGKKMAPYLDLAPMIRRLLDSFGRERLMWATDCPYQIQEGHTYLDSIELVRSRLGFLSADDRAWLLRKTAQRVFFN